MSGRGVAPIGAWAAEAGKGPGFHAIFRHGRACPGHPLRPAALRFLIRLAPDRQNVWAARKLNHVDGRDKPGHDGKWLGKQDLTRENTELLLPDIFLRSDLLAPDRRRSVRVDAVAGGCALPKCVGLTDVMEVGSTCSAARPSWPD